MEFGSTPDSRSLSSGIVNRWFVSRIEDTASNYILFRYKTLDGQTLPAEILYTGNTKADVEPYIT